MYKYVLFDLDGTLTDSARGIKNCIKYSCERMNLAIPSEEVLDTFLGPPLAEKYAEVFGLTAEKAQEAVDVYRERFAPIGLFENDVYDGVTEMLRCLKNAGCILGVATSKPEIYAKKILDHFDLTKYFDVLVGTDLVGGKHDKTDVMKEALSKMNPTEKAIMVGDRCFDIESAHILDVYSLAVTYGYGTDEEIRKAKPDFVAETPLGIADIILGKKED